MSDKKFSRSEYYASFHFLVFALFLLVTGTILLTGENKKVSKIEKRNLKPIPEFTLDEIITGNYSKAFSGFVSDQFPLRNELLELTAILKNPPWLLSEAPKIILMTPEKSKDLKNKSGEEAVDESDIFDPNATGRMNNNLFVYENKVFQLFGAPPSYGKYYSNNLNKLHKAFGDSVRIYSLVFPSPAEFYVKGKYDNLSANEKDFIDTLNAYLDPKIKSVDAYSEMAKHKREYLFFGTDHHWTARGAYHAYVAFCETAGMKPKPLSSYTRKVNYDFIGSLYAITRDPGVGANPDSLEYFVSDTKNELFVNYSGVMDAWQKGFLWNESFKGGSSYQTFLGGDAPAIKIISGVKNNRRILVFKESFGNAFLPFLIENFSEIYVADFRYFPFAIDKFIKTYKITDILVLANSFSAATPFITDRMIRMMFTSVAPLDINKELNHSPDKTKEKSKEEKDKNKEVPVKPEGVTTDTTK
ncbi:hypothetical protein MASR1M107_09050 [Ignavibacteriales bacterium]